MSFLFFGFDTLETISNLMDLGKHIYLQNRKVFYEYQVAGIHKNLQKWASMIQTFPFKWVF